MLETVRVTRHFSRFFYDKKEFRFENTAIFFKNIYI